MAADGRILIDTKIDTKGIGMGIDEIMSRIKGLGGLVKKIGFVVAGAFGVKTLIDFGKQATELGSDLAEVQNVVDVTFTSMSNKVNEFAKNAMYTAGLSETMAKQFVGTFGAMSKSFGFSESAAYEMSTALAQLSGDVASFYNISQDLAYIKLKSVFTGETETLKDLGIVMTQNALDAYAMANGYGKTTSAMTEQEKVALRYQFVLEQLSGASGDFMRTSDGWANRIRVIQLQISSLKATIGQGLINIFNPILGMINIVLARLATLANAFKAFTELITGGKSGANGNTGISDEMNQTAESYGAAADSANEYADAAKAAGGAAKKAGKEAEGALASFDKLNVQPDQSSSGGGGGGANGGAQVQEVDYGTLAEGELDKSNAALDALIARVKELKDLFMTGFWEGMGDLSVLDSIRDNISSIRESLVDIFTDGTVLSAANDMINTLAYDMGRITGAFASAGLTIADNITGGFARYLQQNKERIKGYLVSMFDITSSISTISANFAVAMARIFEAFRSDSAKQLTADIIKIFSDAFMGVTEFAGKLARDVLDTILTPFTNNAGKIKEAVENTIKPIETVFGTLAESVAETFDRLNQMYDEHLAPLFVSIRDGFDEIIGTFVDGYNQYLAPVLDRLADKFSEVWEGHIQPAINSAIEVLGVAGDAVKAFWEGILQPTVNWIAENILPVVSPVIEGLGTVFTETFGIVGDIVNGFLQALKDLLEFITKVFQGDWSGAWETVKSSFENSINRLPEIAQDVVDRIKKMFSDMIDGILESIKKLDDAGGFGTGVAGKLVSGWKNRSATAAMSSGEPILPRLASGTVVPPRAGEFAAILGDNNRETEVVSPLSTMKQAMLEALAQAGGTGGGDINLTVNLDGRVVYQNIIKQNRMEKSRTGTNPLLV